MKIKTLFPVILLAFAACKNDNSNLLQNLTPCLEAEIELFKSNSHAISVLTTVSNGEHVYKFRTIPGCGDGPVYNSNCEVVCCDGKCAGPRTNCPELDYSEWDVIWEK